jgi:hypothetical protein
MKSKRRELELTKDINLHKTMIKSLKVELNNYK